MHGSDSDSLFENFQSFVSQGKARGALLYLEMIEQLPSDRWHQVTAQIAKLAIDPVSEIGWAWQKLLKRRPSVYALTV